MSGRRLLAASGQFRMAATGEGVSELGYADVCALVRTTQLPRPVWWSDSFDHDLTVTRPGPPATAEDRRYWSRVAEVCRLLEAGGGGVGSA